MSVKYVCMSAGKVKCQFFFCFFPNRSKGHFWMKSPLCGVGEAEEQLFISAKRRFPKPTNPCRNLKIFMEENLLKKIVLAAPSVDLFPKHSKSLRKKNRKMSVFM